jgi:hypothetical protein
MLSILIFQILLIDVSHQFLFFPTSPWGDRNTANFDDDTPPITPQTWIAINFVALIIFVIVV